MKNWMSRVAVLAAAALIVACGSAAPTAISPTPAADDGVAAAQWVGGGFRIEPAKCEGSLAVDAVDGGEGWVKMEAAFKNEKGQAFPCGVVSFSIFPEADLRNPRFQPNQVIVSGAPGLYYLTASGNGNSLTVKVLIK